MCAFWGTSTSATPGGLPQRTPLMISPPTSARVRIWLLREKQPRFEETPMLALRPSSHQPFRQLLYPGKESAQYGRSARPHTLSAQVCRLRVPQLESRESD